MMDKNNRKTGNKYEEMAASYLENIGYSIIERNHRNKCGELDIIALDKSSDTIVIVEVKYRSGTTHGDPLEAVDYRKQRRISKATLCYLTQKRYSMDQPCRFDVIAFYKDNSLKHIQNAFLFCG